MEMFSLTELADTSGYTRFRALCILSYSVDLSLGHFPMYIVQFAKLLRSINPTSISNPIFCLKFILSSLKTLAAMLNFFRKTAQQVA